MNFSVLVDLLGFEFSLLILGLLFIRLVRVDLLKTFGIFALLVGVKVTLSLLAFPDVSIVPILIVAVSAFLAVLLLTGVAGDSFSSDNYGSLLIGLGLFPWYISSGAAIGYVMLSLVLVTILTEFRVAKAFKAIGERKVALRYAKRRLSAEKYSELGENGSAIFAVPIAISAFVVACFMSLN